MNKIEIFLIAATMSTGTIQAQTVQFFSPSVVRIMKTADGKNAEHKSEVVIATPQKVQVKTSKEGKVTVYTTSSLTVKVDDGAVSFYDSKGNRLLTDNAACFTPINEGVDKGAYKVGNTFNLDADEPLYGMGLTQSGKMSIRGEHRTMEQSNLEDFANFFQSIKGYGIYWDNYSPTRIDDNGESVTLESQVGSVADYYFMYGGNADGVIAEMRMLTGKVPMLPMWTYGFNQSRERYKSSGELLDVVHNYRSMGIPFDGIIQDWRYWGSNYTWNAMDFLDDNFLDGRQMIEEVHRQKAHIMTTIWSSFGPQTMQYKELKARGELFDFETWPSSGLNSWPPNMKYPSEVRVYDSYSKGARDIYWKYLANLHDMGVDGWWMDSTDPDHTFHSEEEYNRDLDTKTAMGSWRSVRNLYPYMCVGGVTQHQREVDKDKRVFILTRSYYAGQQRFGANMWSGDVNSSWESLRHQIPGCLNYTLTGNPNTNTDIGGFFAQAYNKNYLDNTATRNPQYQELYVRWMQFGLFCPMMRSHGTEVYRELYYYGKPGEPVYDALLSAVKMRYELLPYIYSTSWQVTKNDDSFMRALIMDFKEDRNVWDCKKEFMFGRNLLVCPVVDPLFTEEKIIKTDAMTGWDRQENGDTQQTEGRKLVNGWPECDWSETRTYEVYLPKGADWYDYWTNNKFQGGQTLKADAPIAHSPLYVRAGSILPMGKVMQNTAERDWSELTLKVYPGADAEFTLYEDEGDNYNYEQGKFTEIPLSWNEQKQTLTIGARKGEYAGMLKNRTFTIVLPDGKTKKTNYKGNKLSIKL